MARALRLQHAGGWYHVVNRGINRAAIFCDQGDGEHFLALLSQISQRYVIEVHGYVLMGNHYHLILHVPEGNLSRGLQWLNVSYSIWFNRRHGRVGPLFQGRFKSVPVAGGGWLYRLSQYVHLNPVRVKWLGLDKHGRRLEGLGLKQAASATEAASRLKVLREHAWSSYRAYAGYSCGADWLHQEKILGRAGGGWAERRKRYRSELERYVSGGYAENWAERLRSNLAVGAEEFLRAVKCGANPVGREWPAKRALRGLRSFAEVVKAVETVKQEKWTAFVNRHGDWGRDVALWAARACTGQTYRELGAAVGGLDYAAVGEAVRRMESQRKVDRAISTACRQALETLQI